MKKKPRIVADSLKIQMAFEKWPAQAMRNDDDKKKKKKKGSICINDKEKDDNWIYTDAPNTLTFVGRSIY